MKARQIELADAITKLLNKATDDERVFMTEVVGATLEALCDFTDESKVNFELRKIVDPTLEWKEKISPQKGGFSFIVELFFIFDLTMII